MPFSNQTANTILNSYCGTGYLGLLTAAPTSTDSGTTVAEVSTSEYARAQISSASGGNMGASNSAGAANKTIQNIATIYFPEAETGWGTITHFAIFDAATGGNVKVYNALTSSVSVSANTVPLFRSGQLQFTLS